MDTTNDDPLILTYRKERWRLGPLGADIRNHYIKATRAGIGQWWKMGRVRQRLGNPRWDERVGWRGRGVVYGGDATTTTTLQPRPKSIPYPLELNILPLTYHNLIIIHPRRSGPPSSTPWHRAQVFRRAWRKGKIRSCSNTGNLTLCISQLCCGARNHSVIIPPISPTYRTGILVSGTKLTAGGLTKQLRMVNYRTFSLILLQFR